MGGEKINEEFLELKAIRNQEKWKKMAYIQKNARAAEQSTNQGFSPCKK